MPAARPLLPCLLALALCSGLPASALAQEPAAPGVVQPVDAAEGDLVDEQPLTGDTDDPPPSTGVPAGALPPPTLGPPVSPMMPPPVPVPPLVTSATVGGRVARLRVDGKAAIPRGAPRRIRAIIAAANEIVGRPYKWGGGHARMVDRGYDCSGAVSYALVRAGLLDGVRVSGGLARWAVAGQGRWLTVHANRGHVYLEVAGLRLDTSEGGDVAGRPRVRWRPVVGRRTGFRARHPVGL